MISAQVLSEFYVTVTRKLPSPLPDDAAQEAVEALAENPTVPIDASLVRSAVGISKGVGISYWDGLIVAAAAAGGCERLLSEDLNAGQQIAGVRTENPFA